MKEDLEQFVEELREEIKDMMRQIQEIQSAGPDVIKASMSLDLDGDWLSKEGDLSRSIGLYVSEGSVEVSPR